MQNQQVAFVFFEVFYILIIEYIFLTKKGLVNYGFSI